MTVRVIHMQNGSGTPVVTSFSDNFNRANTVDFISRSWIMTSDSPLITAASNNGSGFFRITGNRLICGTNSGAGGVSDVATYPLPVIASLNGKAQFAELQYITDDGGAGGRVRRSGPCVFASGNMGGVGGTEQWQAYGIIWRTDIADTIIARYTINSAGATATPLVSMASPLANDIWRIKIVPGVTNTITAFLNGTQVGSTTDATFTTGSPCIVAHQNNLNPNTVTVDNFSCGKA
jgi:hypothetical protein